MITATTRYRLLLLPLGLVLMLLAATADLQIAALAWIAWAPLLVWMRTASSSRRAVPFALVLSALTTLWVLHLADFLSPPALLLVPILWLVDIPPLLVDRAAARRLSPGLALLAFPVSRVLAEWSVAAVNPMGGVLSTLGLSQYQATALIQVAAVTGVLGITFLVALVNAAAAALLTAPFREVRRGVAAVGAAVGLLLIGGQARLVLADTAPPPTAHVVGISPPADAFHAASRASNAAELGQERSMLAATEQAASARADLIVWSEYAVYSSAESLPGLLDEVGRIAAEHRVHIQVATTLIDGERPVGNRAVLLGPDGTVIWEYDKQHPVPGNEPFPAGAAPMPVADTDHGRLTAAICFDGEFPDTIAHAGRAGADILLLPVMDWPGIGILHQQGATFRSIENGLSTVRQASGGVAAVIDPYGRILASVDHRSVAQQVLHAQVPTSGAATLAPHLQLAFVGANLVLLIGLALAGRRRASTGSPLGTAATGSATAHPPS